MRVAAIDIGSNTVRLLIGEIDSHGGLTDGCARRIVVRLGEGMSEEAVLSGGAVARALEALSKFREEIDRFAPDVVLAVATSAVRRANNQREFLNAVMERTGIVVRVIDGLEEAELTYLGVRSGMGAGERDAVLDIGGGSTECVFAEKGKILRKLTVDLGVITLSENHLHSDPPTRDDIAELHRAIVDALDRCRMDGEGLPPTRIIGTAGTLTTLAALDQGLHYRNADRIHGYRLSASAVERWEKSLRRMRSTERRALPSIEPGREDLILPGTAILLEFMKRIRAEDVLVSDTGLREGIIVDWLAKECIEKE